MSLNSTLSLRLPEDTTIFLSVLGNSVETTGIPGSSFVNPLEDGHLAQKVDIYLQNLIKIRDLNNRLNFAMNTSRMTGLADGEITASFEEVAKLSQELSITSRILSQQRAQLETIPKEEIDAALAEMGYINPKFDALTLLCGIHYRPYRIAEVVLPSGADIKVERDEDHEECIHVIVTVDETETYFTLDETEVDVSWVNNLPQENGPSLS